MRYIDAAARPIIPNDTLREALLATVMAIPALWAVGEMVLALGSPI